jgi:hypothetical protein
MDDRAWLIAIVSAILFAVIVILWPKKPPK